MNYEAMNIQQRAQYLLDQGVTAKLEINSETFSPAYVPQVIGVGNLQCGFFESPQVAIEMGTAWLLDKAGK